MPLPCHSALHEEVIRELERIPDITPLEPAILAAAIGSTAIAVVAGWYLVTRPPNLRRYDPDEYGPEFRGLKGWLLPLAALVILEPIRVALVGRCRLFLLSSEMWALLVDFRWPVGTDWGSSYILWYAVVPPVQLVLAGAVAGAFFLRRRSFRTLALGYLGLVMLSLLVESFLISQVFGFPSEVITEQFRVQEQWLLVTIFGGTYLLTSRRVHATFHK